MTYSKNDKIFIDIFEPPQSTTGPKYLFSRFHVYFKVLYNTDQIHDTTIIETGHNLYSNYYQLYEQLVDTEISDDLYSEINALLRSFNMFMQHVDRFTWCFTTHYSYLEGKWQSRQWI